MSVTQTIEIPASHRLTIDVPPEVPVGPVTLTYITKGAFDSRLNGAVDPALYGRGSVNGDIIGPFFEEWGGEHDHP